MTTTAELASLNLYQARSTSSATMSIIPREESGFASYLQAVLGDGLQQVPPELMTSSHDHEVVPEVVLPRERSPRPAAARPRKLKNHDDGEIDIFAADKYFSAGGVADISSQETRPSTPSTKNATASAGSGSELNKSRSLTWTVAGSRSCGSESSGNSHAALLRDRRRPARRLPLISTNHADADADADRSSNGRLLRLSASLWCSSCSGIKKSVKVDKSCATENGSSFAHNATVAHLYEQNAQSSWSPASWRIEMASPGPWPWLGSTRAISLSASSTKPIARGGAAASFTRQISKAPASAAELLINSSLRRNGAAPVRKEEDDLGSESSSDLFEIESLALNRPTEYEPSEASIDWSVLTASAANVSVASDRSCEVAVGKKQKVKGPGVSSPRLTKTTGMLLPGCASHKAVKVSSGEAQPASRKLQVGKTTAAEAGRSISPVVASYHVELEPGAGSGRAVVGRSTRSSW
ncbi:Protein phytochrome kinase substrate 3 [Apostasia shenzhenica]|uniref:Protein phytochrome kinase substrate 3 n=1 Tax=Apostasia shenzhenica TaxID=1088818 RepID=A0A2I0A700_9ASPA|nr:Protein phytochrome kinase substrate 3 [Apostasia shenzhenica]